jgi:hypothetical protein
MIFVGLVALGNLQGVILAIIARQFVMGERILVGSVFRVLELVVVPRTDGSLPGLDFHEEIFVGVSGIIGRLD